MKATIKTLPSYRVAYMRNVGPYGAEGGIPSLWNRLSTWAGERGLWTADRICLGISHDNPRVTAPDQCRYDAAIAVSREFRADEEVEIADSAGGTVGSLDFEGSADEIGAAWDRVFSEWLPQSAYQPDDRPCIELYRGDSVDTTTGIFKCELCVPVRPR